MLIVLTGPESSAKSTLTAYLGAYFEAPTVPEVAREYLQERTTYTVQDLIEIAHLQRLAEAKVNGALRFADTDLQVIQIWCEERFGQVPAAIARAYRAQCDRAYLLCKPDIPWVPDPQRQNPHDRARLFARYRFDLEARGLRFEPVTGCGADRRACAITAVKSLLAGQGA